MTKTCHMSVCEVKPISGVIFNTCLLTRDLTFKYIVAVRVGNQFSFVRKKLFVARVGFVFTVML